MSDDARSTIAPTDDARARFRRTLVRVIAAQVAALALLWLLQSHFTR